MKDARRAPAHLRAPSRRLRPPGRDGHAGPAVEPAVVRARRAPIGSGRHRRGATGRPRGPCLAALGRGPARRTFHGAGLGRRAAGARHRGRADGRHRRPRRRRGRVRALARSVPGHPRRPPGARLEGDAPGRAGPGRRTCSWSATPSSTSGSACAPRRSASLPGPRCHAARSGRPASAVASDGARLPTGWRRVISAVDTFADLEPELVGAVETALDMLAPVDQEG